MKQGIVSNFIKKQLPFMLLVGLWIVYILVYIALKQHQETVIYVGVLAPIIEGGLDLVNISLTFLLWKRTTGQEKTIFALFCVSFLMLTIADVNFYILGITNYPEIAAPQFRISFTVFLVFQLLIWVIIFQKSKPVQNGRTSFISCLPVAIIMLIIFTIFLLASLTWKVHVSSLIELYVLSDAIFQVTSFVFVLLCLAIAVNKQIRFIAAGYLIIIAFSFFTESSYLTQITLSFPCWEGMWFLGLLLITFGFSNMLKNSSNLKMDRWLNSLNSVQSQCTFWCFLLCMLLLIAFCGILIGYNLLKVLPLQYLLSVLIGFSVLAVLISSILARVLSAPFERVKAVIDSYMNGKEIDMTLQKHSSCIYEFELLEGFLTRSFEVLKEKNRAQQELFNCATQVAHDIRSPLVALDIVSKLLPELPEQKRVLIRNATQRINDIANNLLETHRLKGKEKSIGTDIKEDIKPELVSSLLDSLVSEKRVQMSHKSIDLILEIENSVYSSFVRLEAIEFKRLISNLINNASEAIHGTNGIIRLILEKESTPDNSPSTINHQLSTKMLTIKIIDNGRGIPEDVLPKIKQGGMSIGKKEGAGLGISGAIQNIKKWSGTYDIQSKVGEGTTFIIKLPITEAPDWFQNRLEIVSGMNIIVLDDDQSIHDVWETRFQEYIKTGQIVLEHFYTPSTFIEYCQNLPLTKVLFLIDYELLGFDETGLDLIEKLNLKNQAVLVTSRYEESAIMAKIIKLGIKTIPKNFAPYIPIYTKTD